MYKIIWFYTFYRELFIEKTWNTVKNINKPLKKPFFNNSIFVGIVTFYKIKNVQ